MANRVYPDPRSASKRAAENCAVSATPCSSPISVNRASRASWTSQSQPGPEGRPSRIVRGSLFPRSASRSRASGGGAPGWAPGGAASCPEACAAGRRDNAHAKSRARLFIFISSIANGQPCHFRTEVAVPCLDHRRQHVVGTSRPFGPPRSVRCPPGHSFPEQRRRGVGRRGPDPFHATLQMNWK